MNKSKIYFNAVTVMAVLGKGTYRKHGSEYTYRKCPFCGKTDVFSINVEKSVYNCPACGAHGKNAVRLFISLSDRKDGRYEGTDGYKHAAKDIFDAMESKKILPSVEPEQEAEEEEPKASPKKINIVYRTMADLLGLSKEHAEKLRERGIDPYKFKDRMLFCSVPDDPKGFVRKLREKLKELTGDDDLAGVPGFYKKNGEWRMSLLMNGYAVRTGFFCFAVDEHGLAAGAQIRLDDTAGNASQELIRVFGNRTDAERFLNWVPGQNYDAVVKKFIDRKVDVKDIPEVKLDDDGHYTVKRHDLPKYVWFSSRGKNKGSSSGAVSTYLPGKRKDVVIVTEGILKAMVIWFLLKGEVAVIGVPGVNSLNGLYHYLDGVVPKDALIVECFDMDKAMNPDAVSERDREKTENVHTAEEKLLKALKDRGFAAHTMKWDSDERGFWKGNWKGLDDFLNAAPETVRKAFTKYLFTLKEKSRSAA